MAARAVWLGLDACFDRIFCKRHPQERLKTGAAERFPERNLRRAEFFALPVRFALYAVGAPCVSTSTFGLGWLESRKPRACGGLIT
jgi:hypothetical protein